MDGSTDTLREQLDPGLTNAKRIENTQTENSIPNEGYVTFDIRLTLTYCEKTVKIIINVEAQKSTNAKKLAESKNHLIAMLEDLLCKEEQEEKKKRLAQKYEMKMTVELERRLKDMCNLSDLVEERGIMLGKEQGKQEEIFLSVQEGDYSPERGAQKLKISLVEFQKRMLEAGYGNSWQ